MPGSRNRPRPGERGEFRVVAEEHGTKKIELCLAGQVVSWLWIHNLHWRVGHAGLRMGGIGGVGTDAAHRYRGYSRRCMQRACEYMHEQGFAMSALFGIGNFYHKWGFASAVQEPGLVLPTGSIREAAANHLKRSGVAGFRISDFKAAPHARQVLNLYAANNHRQSGSLVRPGPKVWPLFRMGSSWGGKTTNFVVLDRQRRVRGYASCDKKGRSLVVVEVGYRDARVFPALAGELARRARARRVTEVTLRFPLHHGFAQYLHRWDAGYHIQFAKGSNGMARIIRLEETMTGCRGELSQRLNDSGLKDKRFAFALVTDIGTVTLVGDRGRVTVRPGVKSNFRVRMPQSVLTQLLMGYRSVEDAASLPSVAIPRELLKPMTVLFPPGTPYMYSADRF